MSRTPCSSAFRSVPDNAPIRRWSLCFATARTWSVTATTSRPSHWTLISNGGPASGELDSGITTTVRRNRLKTLPERMTHGRVFAISEPNVGSSRTHHTSPRCGSTIALARDRLHPPGRQTRFQYPRRQRNYWPHHTPEQNTLHAPEAWPRSLRRHIGSVGWAALSEGSASPNR